MPDLITLITKALETTTKVLDKYVPSYKSSKKRKYNKLVEKASKWLEEQEKKK